jgi:hypothetical protein
MIAVSMADISPLLTITYFFGISLEIDNTCNNESACIMHELCPAP